MLKTTFSFEATQQLAFAASAGRVELLMGSDYYYRAVYLQRSIDNVEKYEIEMPSKETSESLVYTVSKFEIDSTTYVAPDT